MTDVTARVTALLSRKFTLALVAVIITAVLCWFGKVDQSVFSTVIIAIVGGYIAGNVVQKATATPAPAK